MLGTLLVLHFDVLKGNVPFFLDREKFLYLNPVRKVFYINNVTLIDLQMDLSSQAVLA